MGVCTPGAPIERIDADLWGKQHVDAQRAAAWPQAQAPQPRPQVLPLRSSSEASFQDDLANSTPETDFRPNRSELETGASKRNSYGSANGTRTQTLRPGRLDRHARALRRRRNGAERLPPGRVSSRPRSAWPGSSCTRTRRRACARYAEAADEVGWHGTRRARRFRARLPCCQGLAGTRKYSFRWTGTAGFHQQWSTDTLDLRD